MALAVTVEGSGKLVSRNVEKRRFTVNWGVGLSVTYEESNIEETREWVALTQDAAEAEANTAVQPTDSSATYTYRVDEINRVIGSYKLTRNYHKESVEAVT